MNNENKNSIIAIIIITLIVIFALSSAFLVAKFLNKKQVTENKETKTIETPQTDNSIQQYMNNMQHTVKANWNPKTNTKNSTQVVLKYRIHKNGEISDIGVVKSSGNKELDNTAIEAVKKSSPLAELPDALPKNYVDVNFSFDYNIFRGNENK